MGSSPAARRAFPPHWAGLDTWPRLGKPNQGKQWMVPGASRGEGSVQNSSTELGIVLQPRGEEGAALGAGVSPQLWYFSGLPEVMETQNLTCLHPPPHPTTQQSSRNAQNPQLTPRWRHPPPKLWCPRAPVRAERRKQPFPSSPIQQNSLEQAGSIIHAGNKAVVVSWALGELGGEFLFFK